MAQPGLEDTKTPLNVPLSAKYVRSFAYTTMRDRVPVILTKALDSLVREKDTIVLVHGEESREELKQVIGYISQLKNELQTDKPFTRLSLVEDDAYSWNSRMLECVQELGHMPSYFQIDWMFAECYVYRRLREAFVITKYLKDLDPFERSKTESLEHTLSAIKPLATYMNDILTLNKLSRVEEIKTGFLHLLKISLWGNKCDLSLSCGGSVSVQGDPFSLVDEFNSSLLVDESGKIWNALSACKDKTVDIILDNAGYEVVSDLCLAEYLVRRCRVARVRFRAKRIPWYVSDVMVKDFHDVISTLAASGRPFAEAGQRWGGYIKEGVFEIIADRFWTLPYCYNRMEEIDKTLYNDLKTSKLLIFKGDLNYRKLVGDINWPTTYPFKAALREFNPSSIATLRTLKADVICGLKNGQAEEAAKISGKWQVCGDFAVIQFNS